MLTVPHQDLYTDTEREDELLMQEEVEKVKNTINDYWKTKAGLSKGMWRHVSYVWMRERGYGSCGAQLGFCFLFPFLFYPSPRINTSRNRRCPTRTTEGYN